MSADSASRDRRRKTPLVGAPALVGPIARVAAAVKDDLSLSGFTPIEYSFYCPSLSAAPVAAVFADSALRSN